MEMPKFLPRYTSWKIKLEKLQPRQFVLVEGEIKDQSVRAACSRASKNGKRFCFHSQNGIRTVWRVE